jgi:hypothetical protein
MNFLDNMIKFLVFIDNIVNLEKEYLESRIEIEQIEKDFKKNADLLIELRMNKVPDDSIEFRTVEAELQGINLRRRILNDVKYSRKDLLEILHK